MSTPFATQEGDVTQETILLESLKELNEFQGEPSEFLKNLLTVKCRIAKAQ
ncbi:MAG: hypothetical protein HRT88_21925, partial [Lentisphaeraceae bacterium]|nr:hypothetical protein [Lentisphaeraceae bacterium]